jgi:hypothetical protein
MYLIYDPYVPIPLCYTYLGVSFEVGFTLNRFKHKLISLGNILVYIPLFAGLPNSFGNFRDQKTLIGRRARPPAQYLFIFMHFIKITLKIRKMQQPQALYASFPY